MNISQLLLIAAAVCFGLGAIGVAARVNWTNAGLCLATLSLAV